MNIFTEFSLYLNSIDDSNISVRNHKKNFFLINVMMLLYSLIIEGAKITGDNVLIIILDKNKYFLNLQLNLYNKSILKLSYFMTKLI